MNVIGPSGFVRLALLPAAFFLWSHPLLAQLSLQPFVTGVHDPVAITHAGDGSGRLFVTGQDGYVWIVKNGSKLPTPFLDIHTIISSGGERGLLSIAFHPGYGNNGRFFVYYTNPSGDIVISEYHVSSGDPDLADGASGTLVIPPIPHPSFSNHNGGQLQFGPDGYLYAGTGDGGSGGDPFGNGQNLGVLLGKLLRLDVDGPSVIPAGNPFVDGSAATRDEIWAYGLRNPWRFSFDRATGDLLLGDVGQGCWEEVNLQPAGAGGLNYGWVVMEGGKCYAPPSCSPPPTCIDPSFTLPILAYNHSDPADCAVTGGYVYRGAAVPSLTGTYLYADYCSGKIFGATESGGVWTESMLFDTNDFITTFGEDEAGEIYFADAVSGTIYRLEGAAAATFSDDFEDGDASDWNVRKGNWTVTGGALGNSAGKKAEILAPFGGCSLCTVTAQLQIGTPDARVSLLGWHRDELNYFEARLSDKDDTLLLRRYKNGKVVAKVKVPMSITAGIDYEIAITFNGSDFELFLNGAGSPAATLGKGAASIPSGTVGLRVKSPGKGLATAILREITAG